MNVQDKAKKILLGKKGYLELSNQQKNNLIGVLAEKGKVIHRRAFDLVRITKKTNFSDKKSIAANLGSITLIEIKATDRSLGKDFSKYFFGITMRELILAQSFKKQYKFIFVNVGSKQVLELSLPQVFAKIKQLDLVLHTRF